LTTLITILLGLFLLTFVVPTLAAIISYKLNGESLPQAVVYGFIRGSKIFVFTPQILTHQILFPLRPICTQGWFVTHWEKWGQYTGPSF